IRQLNFGMGPSGTAYASTFIIVDAVNGLRTRFVLQLAVPTQLRHRAVRYPSHSYWPCAYLSKPQ
ncbi:hypothetical protein AAVH_41167, partial [Aphelenchoides avenae]